MRILAVGVCVALTPPIKPTPKHLFAYLCDPPLVSFLNREVIYLLYSFGMSADFNESLHVFVVFSCFSLKFLQRNSLMNAIWSE